ncbi:hypothetical protein ONS95_006878 [Cadophora gregata]|uniref:uncharacterized protein n=1 Tax=Cadophora gregata TaxID=51156 RepID=UPI0026DC8BE9|nr:uncharacterized protein ONS95_006878 [Cadophora gregata]KAK0101723.1 hypothetical protein ONS95_006878 [Cadophora gregata]
MSPFIRLMCHAIFALVFAFITLAQSSNLEVSTTSATVSEVTSASETSTTIATTSTSALPDTTFSSSVVELPPNTAPGSSITVVVVSESTAETLSTSSLTSSTTGSSSTSSSSTSTVGTDEPSETGYAQDDLPSVDAQSFTNENVDFNQNNHGSPEPIVLSTEESVQLAVMESQFYTDIAQNSPVPGTQPITLPDVTCGGTSRLARRQKSICKTINSFSFTVYFWSVFQPGNPKNTWAKTSVWESRIKLQMDYLKAAYNPLGIYPVYSGSIRFLNNSAFSNHNKKNRDANVAFMAKYRKGKLSDLNVFMADSVIGAGGNVINGYSRVISQSNQGTGDGIVIDQARLGNEKRNTLTHEMGHWLGLEHTFGDVGSLCTLDDGLLDTTRTSGSSKVIYECDQVPCFGSTAGRVENHMSYSRCRGADISGGMTKVGFTNDQKARMFARYLLYRAGIKNACAKDPTVSRRDDIWEIFARQNQQVSSMQNIKDGECPKPGDPIPGTVHATPNDGADLSLPDSGSKGVTTVAAEAQAPTATVSGVAGETSAVAATGTTSSGAAATSSSAAVAGMKVPAASFGLVQAVLSIFYLVL